MTGTWLVQAAEEEEQGLEKKKRARPSVPAEGSRTVSPSVPVPPEKALPRQKLGGAQQSSPAPSLYHWGN